MDRWLHAVARMRSEPRVERFSGLHEDPHAAPRPQHKQKTPAMHLLLDSKTSAKLQAHVILQHPKLL